MVRRNAEIEKANNTEKNSTKKLIRSVKILYAIVALLIALLITFSVGIIALYFNGQRMIEEMGTEIDIENIENVNIIEKLSYNVYFFFSDGEVTGGGGETSSVTEKTTTTTTTTTTPTTTKAVEKKLTSIAITSQPSKLSYLVGEQFNKSGLVVTATYSDRTTRNVTNKCKVDSSEFNSQKSGNYNITVSYTEGKTKLTKSFMVSVNATVKISYKGSNPLDVNDTGKLTVVSDDSSVLSNVKWSSSNTSAVSVKGNGSEATVTGKGAGTSVITANVGGTTVSYSVSSYGEWSDWSTSYPSGSNLEIQTKAGYLTSTKQYQTSSSNSISGWTLYQTDDNYGWSDYGAVQGPVYSDPGSSDYRKSWSETYVVTEGYNTAYYDYFRYSYSDSGSSYYCNHVSGGSGATKRTIRLTYPLSRYDSKTYRCSLGCYPSSSYAYGLYNGKMWFSATGDNSPTYVWTDPTYGTRWYYQDRQWVVISHTYHFYKWGDYSNWIEGSTPSNTSEKQYKTSNKYRYRKCP